MLGIFFEILVGTKGGDEEHSFGRLQHTTRWTNRLYVIEQMPNWTLNPQNSRQNDKRAKTEKPGGGRREMRAGAVLESQRPEAPYHLTGTGG
jgi:hypothetical protein